MACFRRNHRRSPCRHGGDPPGDPWTRLVGDFPRRECLGHGVFLGPVAAQLRAAPSAQLDGVGCPPAPLVGIDGGDGRIDSHRPEMRVHAIPLSRRAVGRAARSPSLPRLPLQLGPIRVREAEPTRLAGLDTRCVVLATKGTPGAVGVGTDLHPHPSRDSPVWPSPPVVRRRPWSLWRAAPAVLRPIAASGAGPTSQRQDLPEIR